jgi:hypothetical protein
MPEGQITIEWSEYLIDAFQRQVIFLDLLRRRGNAAIDMQSQPMATVLRFDHEVIMSGTSLPRPMNYALSRIIAPLGIATDPDKRPVVVIDPRAGEGPGIGGFKAESEIGDALNAGHPVYFIGFSATPEPGQQFLDVVEGQIKFFECVVERHPKAPLPFAIGNCQAGYQTLMVAMLRPDLFGPCLLAGSPMSFWQGRRGENPMRYAGGLNGGSWLTALTSDLGHGTFDGSWLVLNFDKLGPANWLWSKQYDLYVNADTGGDRYLAFERWWGDFVEFNGDEMQYLVDNLFIGDKLTRNELRSSDGTVFDPRNVTSPIIIFTSMGDNISPPQETLGWIMDLYGSVDDILATQQTIIYCVNQKIGHLALFVSSKVGAKEDEAFVALMDVIDCLPPGLFEMVISPHPADAPDTASITQNWVARFEARSLEDIRNIGRNSPDEDRAFATVAMVSARNLAAYRRCLQPWVRSVSSQAMADMAKALNPLRLSYTIFADRNPLMRGVGMLAKAVTSSRQPVAADNQFLGWQNWFSGQLITGLEHYRRTRDAMQEKLFFDIYGAPVVQEMVGLDRDAEVRPQPRSPPETRAAQKLNEAAAKAALTSGGFAEALVRSVLYVTSKHLVFDQRSALALNVIRQHTMHLSLPAFKAMVRRQAAVLRLEGDTAVQALAAMVPGTDQRTALLEHSEAIVSAGDELTAEQRGRLFQLSQILPIPPAKLVATAISPRIVPVV